MQNIIILQITKNEYTVLSTDFFNNSETQFTICSILNKNNEFQIIQRDILSDKITTKGNDLNIENLLFNDEIFKEHLIHLENINLDFRIIHLNNDDLTNIKDFNYKNYISLNKLDKDLLELVEEYNILKKGLVVFIDNMKILIKKYQDSIIDNKKDIKYNTYIKLLNITSKMLNSNTTRDLFYYADNIKSHLSRNEEIRTFFKEELNYNFFDKKEKVLNCQEYLLSKDGKFKNIFREYILEFQKDNDLMNKIKNNNNKIKLNF